MEINSRVYKTIKWVTRTLALSFRNLPQGFTSNVWAAIIVGCVDAESFARSFGLELPRQDLHLDTI
jgi:hypothetical protein